MESWEADEQAAVLHEASHDLGVAQKTFMMVLRHALGSMKVRGTIFQNTQSTYSPDRLEPGVAEIMDALGKDRSIARLRGREFVS